MVEAKELAIQRSKEYYKDIKFDRIAMCIISLVIGIAFLVELWSLDFKIRSIYIIVLSIVIIIQLLRGYIIDDYYKSAEQRFARVVKYDKIYTCCYVAEDIESNAVIIIKQDYTNRQLFFENDLISYIKDNNAYKINHMAKY